MATIAEARKAATLKRERREREEAAAASRKTNAGKPKQETKKKGLLDRIRDALSSADDIDRIDSAVDAVTRGVSDADEDAKRKK